jgi:hypothetical protein
MCLAAVAAALGTVACTGARALRWEDVAGEPAAGAVAPAASIDESEGVPAAPSAPAHAEAAPSARGVLLVDGRPVDDGALLEMPRLELACLPAADSLTAPLVARARFDAAAARASLPVGRLWFIVLARDPARSITDPPPHVCRAIPTGMPLKAPLLRVQEPPRRWLIRRIDQGLVDDAHAIVAASAAQSLTAAAHPRVLVDEQGGLLAVALPVEAEDGHPAKAGGGGS